MASILGDPEEIEETFASISEYLRDIFHSPSNGFENYFRAYTSVHNCCVWSRLAHDKSLPGRQLHYMVETILKDHITTLLSEVPKDVSDLELMNFYMKSFDKYKLGCNILKSVFSYLDRYVARNKAYFKKTGPVCPIYVYGIRLWRKTVFNQYKDRLGDAIISLIQKERDSGEISSAWVSNLLSSYVELYRDTDGVYSHQGYQWFFEKKFLKETEHYYRSKVQDFLSKNSFVEYMNVISPWLRTERDRAKLYLKGRTVSLLEQTCKRIVAQYDVNRFCSEFSLILKEGSKENLSKFFWFISIHPDSILRYCEVFQTFIIQQATVAFEAELETASTDPQVYFKIILNLYLYFTDLVQNNFNNETNFNASLDKAFAVLINKNPVTVSTKSDPSKMIAAYCDQVFRKFTGSFDDELDFLADVMLVFKYIDDKDVFLAFYTKMLARRLLGQSSQMHVESTMVSKLKQACGFEYTTRLQRMIDDIVISHDLNQDFKTSRIYDSLKFEFSVQVLNSCSWKYTPHDFTIPKELEACCGAFTKFYTQLHSSRKLQWFNNMSKGELVTNCFQNRYTILASTYQIAVLLQFNTFTTMSVNEIMTNTGIKMDILTQVIETLLKTKILVKEDNTTFKDFDVDENTRIALYTKYLNKKLKININAPIRTEVKADEERLQKHIEESRKINIQATIVRIMKSRQTLEQSNLVAEVAAQLSPKFSPDFELIKKCINILIQKEFIEMDPAQSKVCRYLA